MAGAGASAHSHRSWWSGYYSTTSSSHAYSSASIRAGLYNTLEERVTLLEQEIRRLNSNYEELLRQAKLIREEMMSSNEKCKELEKKVIHLEEQLEKKRTAELKLKIGQLGFQFEQSVCWEVFPEVFKNDTTSYCSFKNLLMFLNMTASQVTSFHHEMIQISDEQLRLARERFSRLKHALGWDQQWTEWSDSRQPEQKRPLNVFIAIKLKKMRTSEAHPKVDMGQLMAELNEMSDSKLRENLDGLPLWLIPQVKPFIKWLQELKDNNPTGSLVPSLTSQQSSSSSASLN